MWDDFGSSFDHINPINVKKTHFHHLDIFLKKQLVSSGSSGCQHACNTLQEKLP
jgi:hypothetical protein